VTPEQIMRICEMRSRVIRATYEALREDSHHKSSEAACEISLCLPNMFEADQRPTWAISIYSYVIGSSRQHTWTDQTLDGALALAEKDVKDWCFRWEMRAFDREMGGQIEDEADA
jgi:hypothetical protein